LNAIFAGSPSTFTSISPSLSPTSSARALMTSFPEPPSPEGCTCSRTMPLPSRAKIAAMRAPRMKSSTSTTVAVLNSPGISWL